MSNRRTTLFVAGFGFQTRARDLSYKFERYGRLIRCEIPTPRNHQSKPYAFVEFEDERDAEDAYHEMHGRKVFGHTLDIQWARNAPSRSWRHERSNRSSLRRSHRSYSRSLSRTRSQSRGRNHSSRSDRRDRTRSRSPEKDKTNSEDRAADGRTTSPSRKDTKRRDSSSPSQNDRTAASSSQLKIPGCRSQSRSPPH